MRNLISRRTATVVASAAFLLLAATSLPAALAPAAAQESAAPLTFSTDNVSVQVAADVAQFAITTSDFTVVEAPEPEPAPLPAQTVTTPSAGGAATPAAPTGPVATVTNGPSVGAVFADINAQRAAAGLAPFSNNGGLQSIAQNWSAVQASRNASGHNPSFSSLTQSIGCGYGSENVAYTMGPSQTPMTFWMGSPPHRANILSGSATAVGVGAATSASGITYYTLNFGNC